MTSFDQYPLPEKIQKSLTDLKFTQPTAVQAKVIPLALEGKDLVACAETGSGKTAAYGIPMVTRLAASPLSMGLVLAPTRELVHQISEFLRDLCKHDPSIRVVSLVGGADMRKQLQQLSKKPRLVVATPGRLIDHLQRRSVKLELVAQLVLDEGDRMLDMGFAPQLDAILKFVPQERQTYLFTATLPDRVRKLAAKYLQNPVRVDIGESSQPVATVSQSVREVASDGKPEEIINELNKRQGSVIVFARTQQRTDRLAQHLQSFGFKVDLIHGGRTQGQRNRALENFRAGRSRILCATDVAARGLDVPHVEHVINYDLPMMDEDYVHRIGRTGRNGAAGEAVSFVAPEDRRDWMMIVRKYRIQGVDVAVEKRSRPAGGGGRSFGGRGRSSGGRSFGGGGAGRSPYSSSSSPAKSSGSSSRPAPARKSFDGPAPARKSFDGPGPSTPSSGPRRPSSGSFRKGSDRGFQKRAY